MSDSLQPHGLQHTRLPCPSPTPRAYSNSCPSSQWCHPTISSSVIPFSSCLQSFPATGSFQISQFLASGGQSIGVSASPSVLPMNIQWIPKRYVLFILFHFSEEEIEAQSHLVHKWQGWHQSSSLSKSKDTTVLSVVYWNSLSCVQLSSIPCTVTLQAPLFMEFSRQEHWSGLQFPSPTTVLTQC